MRTKITLSKFRKFWLRLNTIAFMSLFLFLMSDFITTASLKSAAQFLITLFTVVISYKYLYVSFKKNM